VAAVVTGLTGVVEPWAAAAAAEVRQSGV